MINPSDKNDRFIYSDVIAPPKGFHVSYALATTYSLNISALVSCMIPLAFKSDTDSKLFRDPVSTYAAFRKLSSKMIVFCDKCQIKPLGNNFNKNFVTLLENIIFPVEVKSSTKYHPAFHPKIWLLKYENNFNKNNTYYRLVVMSRNISYDRSYDVTYVLESSSTNANFEQTENLINFLKYLKKFGAAKKSEIDDLSLMNLIINDLTENHVCFKIQDANNIFTGKFNILPLFDTNSRELFRTELLTNKSFKNVFIMSPFISEDEKGKPSILRQFVSQTENTVKCISAGMTINGLDKNNGNNVDLYQLNPTLTPSYASYSEDSAEDDKDENLEILDDIHAKIYLTETQNKLNLFAGSVNATWAAMNINDEFMINAELNHKKISVQSFFDEINPYTDETDKIESNRFFIKANFLGNVDVNQDNKTADDLIKAFCFCEFQASCKEVEGNEYNIILIMTSSFPPLKEDYTVKINLITLNTEKKPLQEHMLFENIHLEYLTDFYEITLYKGTDEIRKRIIKIETCPKDKIEQRNQIVQNNIFSSEFSIGSYLALMLDDDSYSVARNNARANSLGSDWGIVNKDIPFYDSILKAAAHYPDNVLALKKDLKTLQDNPQTKKCSELIERIIFAIETERGLHNTDE